MNNPIDKRTKELLDRIEAHQAKVKAITDKANFALAKVMNDFHMSQKKEGDTDV